MLGILGVDDTPYLVENDTLPVDNMLETGIINMGSASDTTGQAYFDTSLGVYYGNGTRYECEEDVCITKIAGRKDKSDGNF